MKDSNELSSTNGIQVNGRTMERSLNEITAQLNSALIESGVAYPIYMCIPASGDAFFTLACPIDPSDPEWDRVSQITCDVVGQMIGKTLRSRGLSCAMAGTAMGAADLTVG